MAIGLSAHSCSARAKDGAGIGNVGGFDGAIVDSVPSHHVKKLGISWVDNHGLGFVGGDGILDFALGVAFIALVEGSSHGYGICGMHVDVRESATHAILFAMEGDFFALGGGDVGYCIGYYEARSASGRASGKKYKAQIVIFRILLAINRFSWISWKAKLLRILESR